MFLTKKLEKQIEDLKIEISGVTTKSKPVDESDPVDDFLYGTFNWWGKPRSIKERLDTLETKLDLIFDKLGVKYVEEEKKENFLKKTKKGVK